MDRAYSIITVKEMNEDRRVIRGMATTPEVDRQGDIVDPFGVKVADDIPLFLYHDSNQTVGRAKFGAPTKEGIPFEARIPVVKEAGRLKDRVDEAWQMVKYNLITGVSIGFRAMENGYERMKNGGLKFTATEVLELSLVPVPANASATITAIKSADQAARAASGAKGQPVVRLSKAGPPGNSPGVPGTTNQAASGGFFHSRKETEMNIAEQLSAFDTKKKAAHDRMDAIMKTAGDEGRTLDERETEEYDGLAAETKAIDAHVTRLKAHEAQQVAKAAAVQSTVTVGSSVDVGNVISVKRNAPKGSAFTKFAMALALSKGNLPLAERIAATHCKDMPEVGIVLKAATDAGTTSDATWATPLVQYQDMVSEFIELLRAETILGRLGQVRRVPFNIRIPRQTSGTSGTFVGEGAPAPVRELAFDNITLQWAKASTIVVVTAELAKFSNPAAEALVRQDLINGMAEYLDKRLIDPAYPGVANVSPASLTYGVTPVQASGATLAALDANVRTLMTTFADANLGLQSGVWVMSASLAIRLSMMRTNQDSKAFPDLSVNGGSFYGLPVIVSNNVTPSGSPGDQHLLLINQREVLLADDGQMMIDASAEASVQMNDAPSAGAQSLVSLWQNGLVGLKVDRFINWTKRRTQAVQFIDKAQSYAS
jgi:HK97 family phage major capsid protein/HK97 family phage prohead protease